MLLGLLESKRMKTDDQKQKSIKAARAFEFYVKYLWPLHRGFVKKRISRRCQKCAASERMLPLTAEGICSACSDMKATSGVQSIDFEKELLKLQTLLHEFQGKGSGAYDALVLYSGGKDSSFMIRKIQNEYPKLRVLALSIDNGFMSPVAQENINYLIPKLKVDHLFIKNRKELYIKLFRYALTHLNAEGGYGTVDFSDGELMLDTARKIAAEKSIPLILCGYSRFQVQNGLGLQTFESPFQKEASSRTETAGLRLSDIFTADEIKDYWWQGQVIAKEKIPRLLFPLFCWNLEEQEIIKQVQVWDLLPRESHSPIVTNHQLIPLIGVVDVHQLGYSSFEKEFCRMIREGKADRRHWQHIFEFLEYTSKTGLFVKPAVLESLEVLNLTLEQVKIKFD